MQPSFRIAEIELLEIPVVLRMPFRFGRYLFCLYAVGRIGLPRAA